jgi:hypothetical protein
MGTTATMSISNIKYAQRKTKKYTEEEERQWKAEEETATKR